MKHKKTGIIITLCTLAVILVSAWIIYGNTAITVSRYTVKNQKIPESFTGFTIAQVSDLHNEEFGKNNNRLLEKIRNENPDIIVITGDIIDCHRTDIDVSIDFVEEAVKIAPTYYITGNHEAITEEFEDFLTAAKKAGMIYLDNKTQSIDKNGDTINLTGIDDPFFLTTYISESVQISINKALDNLLPEEGYNILLAHRPNYFDLYIIHEPDLVLSGHVHGGQFRLPFIGGLYAPDQGIFPEYDAGHYSSSNTDMIISRGLGNSRFPFRLNNTPELVVVTLENME